MNELKIPLNLECNAIKLQIDSNRQEIKYQQLLTSKLSKHLAGVDYADKILTVFLTVFSGRNIFSQVKKEKQLLGLMSSIFSLLFCLSSGVVKKLEQETKTRKKKHNKLLYLAKSKLDCVEILVSKSVMDGIIDHNEFLAIMKEKKDYDNQKIEGDKNKLSEIEII